MSSIANALSGATATTGAAGTTPKPPVTDPLASESTFLTLLVSQLQNQDPLNPVDSTQFVSQLTAYSQLEQLIGIHQNTTKLASASSATAGAASPTTSNATPTTTGS